MFYWKVHCFILERPLLSSEAAITDSCIMENKEVPSAKSLVLEGKPSTKSLMYIKN